MSTFSQFLTSIKKSPAPRQITWVCGTEVVLVEEVVQYVIDQLAPDPWNLAHLVAGEDSERDIWAALDQYPLGGSPRVVVVRHAELISSWDRFTLWVKDRTRNPRTYVVMVSAEDKIPKTTPTPEQRRSGEKPEPLEHIRVIGTKGHVVECKPWTSTTAAKSVEWVKSKVPMRDAVARHLLIRSNWNLRMVRDTCLKLSVFPGEVSISVINELLSEQPRDTFTDALMALDRKTAFLAMQDIPTSEIGRVIGLLDAKLDKAGQVHDLMVEHQPPSKIARALGSQAFLLPELMKVSRHYDSKRRMAIREVLAVADEAYQGGQTDGVLEAIVSFW